MALNWIDWVGFLAFTGFTIFLAMWMSRREKTSEDYFLGGRGLSWGLVGISLIASNISTEHFVGMAGAAYGQAGLAIASYEWIAAVSLVIIGFFLLPLYLKMGIYTMPEFLEYRYGPAPRALMAVYMMVAYIGVVLAAVMYSGAIGLKAIFGLDFTTGVLIIGVISSVYTIFGGLKAVAWADFLQGTALLIGGAAVTVIGLGKVGDLSAFFRETAPKFHLIMPADHPDIPWTALLLGIWIPNFFYWGMNQFITQRTLGARNLSHGQLGVMFAAMIKVFVPFIVILPGIIAYKLFAGTLESNDMAYPVLLKTILPIGLRGMMLAALAGAVMSTLAALLNSASTIFTMDLYKRYFNPAAPERNLVAIGRVATLIMAVIACLVAPLPGRFEGVFAFLQKLWGLFSPGIAAAFFFGLIFRRAPTAAAMTALIGGPALYAALAFWLFPHVAFLNLMAATFTALVLAMGIITWLKPLPAPVVFKQHGDVDLKPSGPAKILGIAVLVLVAMLYIVLR